MHRRNLFLQMAFALCSILLLLVAAGIYLYRHHKASENAKGFVQILRAQGTYTDLEGASVSLETYKGKVFFLLSWASWCPSCGEQLAILSRVAIDTGVPIVAVNRGETRVIAKDYLQSIQEPSHITYIVDVNDTIFGVTKGYTTPEIILYNTEGIEVFRIRGTFTEEEIRGALSLLHAK